MSKLLRSYWALILLVILIAGVVWIVDSSTVFRKCVSSKPDYSNSQIYLDCLSVFVVTQNPAITALSTFIIAVFTIVLAGVTNRQARLTKEALIADKAAFVFPFNFNQVWNRDEATTHYHWRLRPMWRNSGDTAAVDVMVHAECEIRNTALPVGHRFNYSITNEPKGFLGPGVENTGGIAPTASQAAITPQDILDSQAGRKFIYLWGWTRYSDVFPDTRRHITKFCWIIMTQGDPLTYVPNTAGPVGTAGTLAFTYAQHPEGNSAEDE
jgi:hypothetical protein